MVTANNSGTVAIWDTTSFSIIEEINVGYSLRSADYNPVDDRIAVGGIRGVELYEVARATETACQVRARYADRSYDFAPFLPPGHELPTC
jgi:hypothetical protein